jgi:mRNA interferase RelE/StbE
VAYEVRFNPSAIRDLKKLEAKERRRIVAKVDKLSEEPRPADAKKLSATEEIYRIRVGSYRVLYDIQDEVLLVLVLKAGHRKDVYRRFKK